jgi:hypothetical protein
MGCQKIGRHLGGNDQKRIFWFQKGYFSKQQNQQFLHGVVGGGGTTRSLVHVIHCSLSACRVSLMASAPLLLLALLSGLLGGRAG